MSFLDLGPRALHMKIETCFFLKTTGPFLTKFCMLSLHHVPRKWESINMMLVTWPRWLPRPYMLKKLQKFSSPKPVDWFFLETWYVASETPSHHSLFKWWPWVDLGPILWQGQIWQLRLVYRKKLKTVDFSETIAACDLKVGKTNEGTECQCHFLTWEPGHLHMKIKTCL